MKQAEILEGDARGRIESIRKYAAYFTDGNWHEPSNVETYSRAAFHDLLWLICIIDGAPPSTKEGPRGLRGA